MLSHWDTLSVANFTATVEKRSFIRSSLKRQQDLSLPQIVLHLPMIWLEHWKSPDIFSSSCLNPPPSCASCSPSPPPPPPYPTPPPAADSCLVGISRWSPKEVEARKTEAEELLAHLFQNTWGFQTLWWKWWFCSLAFQSKIHLKMYHHQMLSMWLCSPLNLTKSKFNQEFD